MNLGIFGDSFAERGNNSDYPSWINFIEERYPSTTSFGVPGSPLYISVNNFISHHKNYDRIIFIVTNPYRYELIGKQKNYFISSANSIDSYLQTVESFSDDWWMLKKCKKWLGVPNLGLELITQHAHKSMIDYIKHCRPDSYIIPAFKNSFIDPVPLSLEEIQAKETELYENDLRKKYHDLRICHLSTNNNRKLANYFINLLQDRSVQLELNNFDRINDREFSKYFKRK